MARTGGDREPRGSADSRALTRSPAGSNPPAMDLRLSEQHQKFRDELRAWLAANLAGRGARSCATRRHRGPPDGAAPRLAARSSTRPAISAWTGRAEWGGRGADRGREVDLRGRDGARRRAADPEHPRHRAPRSGAHPPRQRGAAPALHPADARPATRSGVRASASPAPAATSRRSRPAPSLDGDHFVLNGQKVWTTFGPWADWIFVLARTDSKDRYGGISFMLCKLDTPGVTVRPLRQITGESEFGEVFFEDARVPKENLVGKIGEGWRIAMTVLAYERGAMLARLLRQRYARDLAAARRRVPGARPPRPARSREKVARLARRERGHARQRRAHARELRRRQGARARVVAREDLLERVRQALPRDRARPARSRRPARCAHSPHARPDVDWAREFLWSRAGTIYSGSSEVQRNIIAKRVLGLPQDLRDEASSSPRISAAPQLDARLLRQGGSRSRRRRRVMEHEPRGFERAAVAAARRDGLPRPARARGDRRPGPRRDRARDRAARRRAASACPGRSSTSMLAAALLAAAGGQDALAAPRSCAGEKHRDDRARATRRSPARPRRRRTSRTAACTARSTSCRSPRRPTRCSWSRRRASGARRGAVRGRRRRQTIDLAQRFGEVALDHAADADRPAGAPRARRSPRRRRRRRDAARHHAALRSR